mgnify:CR=1 FL=1
MHCGLLNSNLGTKQSKTRLKHIIYITIRGGRHHVDHLPNNKGRHCFVIQLQLCGWSVFALYTFFHRSIEAGLAGGCGWYHWTQKTSRQFLNLRPIYCLVQCYVYSLIVVYTILLDLTTLLISIFGWLHTELTTKTQSFVLILRSLL